MPPVALIFCHSFCLHDEELAAVGVGAGVGHGHGAVDVQQVVVELILERLAPHAFAAGAVPVGVAALNHEVLNDAVEGQAVVVAFQGMDFKVVHGLGGLVREKAELDDLARLHGDDSDFLPFLGHFQLVAGLFAVVLRGEVLLGDKGLLGIG